MSFSDAEQYILDDTPDSQLDATDYIANPTNKHQASTQSNLTVPATFLRSSSRPKREVSSNANTTRTATCSGFMNNDAAYWTLDNAVPVSCWSEYYYFNACKCGISMAH